MERDDPPRLSPERREFLRRLLADCRKEALPGSEPMTALIERMLAGPLPKPSGAESTKPAASRTPRRRPT